MRTRGLRGGSFVRSLPLTVVFMDKAKAERPGRKFCAENRHAISREIRIESI